MHRFIMTDNKKWYDTPPPIYKIDNGSCFKYFISDAIYYMGLMKKINQTQTFTFFHLIPFNIYPHVRQFNMRIFLPYF